MENRIMYTRAVDEFRHKISPGLLAFGMWLRLAFIGVSAVVGGVIGSLQGEATANLAVAFVIGGGVLASISWWRARAFLAGIEATEPGWAAEAAIAPKSAFADDAARRPALLRNGTRRGRPILAAE